MIATETKSSNTTDTTVGTKLPKLNMALPGPNAKRIVQEDAKWVSPSYTRDYPLVAKRGYGAMVEDVDGNVFLDFAAGIAVCSTGHCHPDVVAAVANWCAGVGVLADNLTTSSRSLEDIFLEVTAAEQA